MSASVTGFFELINTLFATSTLTQATEVLDHLACETVVTSCFPTVPSDDRKPLKWRLIECYTAWTIDQFSTTCRYPLQHRVQQAWNQPLDNTPFVAKLPNPAALYTFLDKAANLSYWRSLYHSPITTALERLGYANDQVVFGCLTLLTLPPAQWKQSLIDTFASGHPNDHTLIWERLYDFLAGCSSREGLPNTPVRGQPIDPLTLGAHFHHLYGQLVDELVTRWHAMSPGEKKHVDWKCSFHSIDIAERALDPSLEPGSNQAIINKMLPMLSRALNPYTFTNWITRYYPNKTDRQKLITDILDLCTQGVVPTREDHVTTLLQLTATLPHDQQDPLCTEILKLFDTPQVLSDFKNFWTSSVTGGIKQQLSQLPTHIERTALQAFWKKLAFLQNPWLVFTLSFRILFLSLQDWFNTPSQQP